MAFISAAWGYVLVVLFGISMVTVTYSFTRWRRWHTREGFLVANRQVGWLMGGASIASSWIWAPALFISVQLAYQKGLAGIFWFTLPNIVALAVFAFLAPRIRERLPRGYTFPQYVKHRLRSGRVHRMFLFPWFFYQLMAIVVQLYAGGNLLSLLTGIPVIIVIPALALIVLAYTLISGFAASVATDFIQLAVIYVAGLIILPLTWIAAGGTSAIAAGFHGIENVGSILDPGVAFSFGVVTSIGLIAGSIADQQNWQRSFAIKRRQLVAAFVFGSIIFGIVPLALATLGFIAVNPSLGIVLPAGIDVSMIGVQTVATLLPLWAVSLFVIMLLAGLCSTMDAGLAATSSLWVVDVRGHRAEKVSIRSGRRSMVAMMLLGILVSLALLYVPGIGLKHLWWIFNTVAACIVVPTVLSLYWGRLSERGVFWGVLVALALGLPAFVYGNLIDDPYWIVGASVFIIAVSTVFCLAMPRSRPWRPVVRKRARAV